MTNQLVVLDVVGLTPKLLAHMPNLAALARPRLAGRARHRAARGDVQRAVDVPHRTDARRARDRRQRLVLPRARRGLPVAPAQPARGGGRSSGRPPARRNPDYTAANVCWWYAMGATTDITVTPRPIYHADGRKSPDAYVRPPGLHDELTGALGEFPLFQYWGPTASLRSSEWIIGASRKVLDRAPPGPAARLRAAPGLRPAAVRPGRRRRRCARPARSTPRSRPLLDDALRRGRDRGGAVRVRHHAGAPAGRHQPAAAAPRACSRSTRRPAWSTWTRGRPARSRWPTTRWRTSTSTTPPTCPRVRDMLAGLSGVDEVLDRDGAGAVRHRPPARGRARRRGRAGRVVHLLLLARRRPRAGLRARRRDPPQARLRPGRAVLRPGGPAGEGQGRAEPGAQEGRAALRDERGAARPVAACAARTAGCPRSADDGPVLLCSVPDAEPGGALAATDVHDLLLQLQGITDVRFGRSSTMSRPVTLFTGQWADLPFEEVCKLAAGWGYDGLEIACWGDHFEVDRARQRGRLRPAQARPAGLARAEGVDDLQPPGGPGGVRRPDRPAAQGHPAGPHLGRRRSRGRAAARRGGDEGHRARRGEARCVHSGRLHRVEDLEVRGHVPAGVPGRHRRRLRRLRAPVEPDPRRVRRGRRAVRARGAPVGDRLRLLDDQAHAGGGRQPGGVRAQLGPVALRLAGPRPGRLHPRLRRPDLPRGLQGRQEAVRRPQRADGQPPRVGRPAPRLGLRVHRTRRRAVGGVVPRAQRDRLRRARSRWSGRTRAWTGCAAPRRP